MKCRTDDTKKMIDCLQSRPARNIAQAVGDFMVNYSFLFSLFLFSYNNIYIYIYTYIIKPYLSFGCIILSLLSDQLLRHMDPIPLFLILQLILSIMAKLMMFLGSLA